MKILVNAFGISSAGGMTVLQKTIYEFLEKKENIYFIYVFKNNNILNLVEEFKNIENIHFKIYNDYGIFFRLLREHLYFLSFILSNNASLIYNFSGTQQLFLRTPSITKVQNILFFTRKLDSVYFDDNKYFLWFKQIWIKRFIFSLMLRYTKNIEIQSNHVKDELSNFINLDNKKIYIKNDFLIESNYLNKPKLYDFNKKITFLYVVGPHFYLPYKNLADFVNTMVGLISLNFNFEIKITLTFDELNRSGLWDDRLNCVTSFMGYVDNEKRMKELFVDNTILISTSVTETVGLHVVEATLNGILSIVPDELYSKCVYGNNNLTYNLFESESLKNLILSLKNYSNNDCFKLVKSNQEYIIQNEKNKYKNCVSIFNNVLGKE
jgi:hypothetical protein